MKYILTLFTITYSLSLLSQDTLTHIEPNEPLTVYMDTSNGQKCGYITGMNCSMYEVFGERYDISDSAEVTAVISYHKGNFKDFTKKVAFEIYSVGENKMPDSLLVSRQQTYRNLILYGNPVKTGFYEPVKVGRSFFVAINFLDYAHYALTDSIAVLSSYHSSRPDPNPTNYGRNVLRVHHHNFVDLYSKTGLNINLALFPIVKFPSVISGISNNCISNNHLKISAPYPNPCINYINLPFEVGATSKVSYQIINESGTVITGKDLGVLSPGSHSERIDLSNYSKGAYYLLLNAGGSTLGISILK